MMIIIIGSDLGSKIISGHGDDKISINGGENNVIAGLGDDIINVNAKNAIIYGDAIGYSDGKDTFNIQNEFENITIQDFETGSDKLIINLRNGEEFQAIEGYGTNNIKIRKNINSDHALNLNSAAGIITATTLAIATTEVMALTDILPANESFVGGNDIFRSISFSSTCF